MSKTFKAVKLSDRVYWVGAIDWAIRDFHGYSTNQGSTYNAYLVMADKITLIDAVKAPFREELLSRISSVVDPASISYIVSNHAEMDHSGCLGEVIEAVRPERVFASTMGVKALKDHFHHDREIVGVKDGESLSLGDRQLTFTETRMIHWPDSMFTYLSDDNVLFSQDGFGMHLASTERFADEIPDDVLEFEGSRYFANILLPFAPRVVKLLEKVAALGLTPQIIAPDHGPIWRKDLEKILAYYSRWSAQKPGRKAVIVYDTMWGSTDSMARAIAEGVTAGGSAVKVMPLKSSHRSDVAGELLEAGALIVGSPTLNNNIFPTVADVMTYLKGLKPANKIGAVFGSYGWSGEATAHLKKILEGMGIEMVGEIMKAKFVPGDEVLEGCFNLGREIAGRLGEERE